MTQGPLASDWSYKNNGAFKIYYTDTKTDLFVIASDGHGWEHVSVTVGTQRCPTWGEMCFVKDLFWGKQDCVIQFHPPQSEYVNHHPFCLHLWRKVGYEFPLPDSIFVGPKS